MAKTKFDLRHEAQRGVHASVGAADLAFVTVKEYVGDAQKRIESYQKDAQRQLAKARKSVRDFDFQPTALRAQTTTVVSARVDELTKDARSRRDAVEKRVADLQSEAQKFVSGNVETATDTYDGLVKRGETVVRRFRNQPAAKETVSNARTTVSKAKTTATQAKKTAKKSPATRSAKATGTAAKKTAKSAAKTVR